MREVVLDTETTGLSPADGHRVVEIGCVELRDRMPTGREFHKYVNPERSVPRRVTEIHGLTRRFLAGHPAFIRIAREFLEFLGGDRLVIHNAPFDLRFLNAELARIGHSQIAAGRAVDTLALARRLFPRGATGLDALCRHYGIDLTGRREMHGAIVDARLLAGVYERLTDGHRGMPAAVSTRRAW